MNPVIACSCVKCQQYAQVVVEKKDQDLTCPYCFHQWGRVSDPDHIFDRCPVCGCRQFYIMKNFNQMIGCLIMLAGIVLVPFTYGLSLPVFALIDWVLYKKVTSMVVCYRCASEFHGFPPKEHFKPFMHHIGLKYDRYR